ncbi:helix-turn-helix domain-containing protein [Dissulfurispira sp.]|uniref:helix-turn-helix domain-containing protein n=1 Tax=Dissulfurispira sp. TaxID=2817609 RepID=UPI002FDB46FA
MDYKTRIKIIKGSRTIKELANILGIPATTLHTYLNGREPSVSFVNRVNEKLNVNPDWLITGRVPIFKSTVFSDDDTIIKI